MKRNVASITGSRHEEEIGRKSSEGQEGFDFGGLGIVTVSRDGDAT